MTMDHRTTTGTWDTVHGMPQASQQRDRSGPDVDLDRVPRDELRQIDQEIKQARREARKQIETGFFSVRRRSDSAALGLRHAELTVRRRPSRAVALS